MNPTSDQALRTALDHETTSIVRQLQADNERLRNELATAKANLGNRYLRSVLNLIAKHRDMGVGGGIHVIDERLVLQNDGLHDHIQQAVFGQLFEMPLEEKLAGACSSAVGCPGCIAVSTPALETCAHAEGMSLLVV